LIQSTIVIPDKMYVSIVILT